ncbi:MAG: Fe-S cluster assembly protein HesB [Candidatus Nanoarchaeia archaeon]
MNLSDKEKKAFQEKILSFYKQNGRKLPWRHSTNRYHIFVSEVMLQQTQVSRVIEKYNSWIGEFPTITALSKASLQEVLRMWSGLGYNSRGKRLWEAAKIIEKKYEGIIPTTRKQLEELPGIGPYSARSILIFADNVELATVDTNIRRILIHEFNLPKKTSDDALFQLAQELLPQGKSREWHNALMDYGALYLTAKKTGIKPKTQQSKFKGSRREIRAAIIKHLISKEAITQDTVEELFPHTTHNIEKILEELCQEKLITKKGKTYHIS